MKILKKNLIGCLFLGLTSLSIVGQQDTSEKNEQLTKIKTISEPATKEKAEKKLGGEGKKETKSELSVSPRFRENIAPEKLSPVRVPRFETSPTIDGKLDDAVWKRAAVFKDFYQTAPGDNIAPSKPTIAYIGYDEENLYVAFYCYDEADKIRATIAKRDAVFGEDNVRIHLDTYDDQRRAYVLGFNPFGIQQDGVYTEGKGEDFSVDIVMESKGVIVSDGWTLEAKIPFRSLRYLIGKDKNWGIHLSRNIDRFNDELDSWMPQDRNISSWLAQEGKITGIENIKVERTLEIVPSIAVSETGERRRNYAITSGIYDPGRFVNQGIKQDIGVNLKFNVTPNITFDFAYNPDFAEIEADAPVVSANQRFPIFFEEKRPFFLEGADIFQSPLQSFYSRQIVDPVIAAKLTGKIGRTSFGFLAASDNAPGNYSDDERTDPVIRTEIDEFLDKNAQFAVLRLKRDVGRDNSLGFFGTARIFPEQRNFTGGFDGNFRLTPKTSFNFQVLGTHSRRCFFEPEFEPALNLTQTAGNREICGGSAFNHYRTGNGLGYFAKYEYAEKNWGWVAEATGRSQDYRADAGFTPRVNTNYVYGRVRLSTEAKPQSPLVRVDWYNIFKLEYDWQGRSQSGDWNSNVDFSFQRNTFLYVSSGVGFERLFEEEFGLKRIPSRPASGAFAGAAERSSGVQRWLYFWLVSSPIKKLSFGANVGTAFNVLDFDFGGGPRFPRVSPTARLFGQNAALDPGTGQKKQFGFDVEYKPIDPFRIKLEYNKTRLVRSDTGGVAFDSNLVTLRSTYQFTRFTFLRARWDYDSIRSNVGGQILLGWNPNPGTAVYLGYNDNFNYNGFNPFTGDGEPRFERNSRTFFIRLSYLFRKSF